jgi:hypothetical protein
MTDSYKSAPIIARKKGRSQLVKSVERKLCQRYALSRYHAQVIAQLQGYGERDV